ncbi:MULTISPECIES: DUF211 domain-containing protein [Thermococcus]|uniref:DUF211 domain-containing protein n=3 Tax=Thermococcus TaxID=2263 RepID=W0I9W4_9EURY|nr:MULTISPECIES: DUF211 domain-containing protein [Thermococcus]ADT84860.1 hypothetical protein TERMP_01885 [Thermococcus barophilus MP]AHF81218.1 Hypothetical protein TES1_1843 [Thermococcus paralvinellae]ALM76085.1 hypothetical protein TBCH5v1_2186 [Thermococcus barophilus]WRS51937.1 DUF211 domain-containing protein [Thermococcus sp. SY098]
MARGIRLLVLDVLKPHQPMVTELALGLSEIRGVEGVNITLVEIDKETENIKITIVGDNLDYDEIVRTIEEFGGVVHSIDMVAAGKRIIEESETPQDKLDEF